MSSRLDCHVMEGTKILAYPFATLLVSALHPFLRVFAMTSELAASCLLQRRCRPTHHQDPCDHLPLAKEGATNRESTRCRDIALAACSSVFWSAASPSGLGPSAGKHARTWLSKKHSSKMRDNSTRGGVPAPADGGLPAPTVLVEQEKVAWVPPLGDTELLGRAASCPLHQALSSRRPASQDPSDLH